MSNYSTKVMRTRFSEQRQVVWCESPPGHVCDRPYKYTANDPNQLARLCAKRWGPGQLGWTDNDAGGYWLWTTGQESTSS